MALQSLDAANYDTLGYVEVNWDDTGKSAGFEAYRVYVRDLDLATDWVLVFETTDNVTTYQHLDYLAPSNRELEYAIVEVTTGNVEGGYDDTATITPAATNYWVIADFDSTLNFRLEHVTKDDFEDKYEEETFGLIGRGRKKDVGTRWGYDGSLTAQMRPKNGKSGLDQKVELESVKLRQGEGNVYLRTPFGDVIKTSIGSLKWTRLEGSGTESWFSVTFPYEEIA